MRDDVKHLFHDLLTHLNLKKTLLNSFLVNEKSASDLIKLRNDAENEMLKIIELETSLIENINIEDYYISQLKDEITRQYSIDFCKISKHDYFTTENEIMEYKDEILVHDELIKKITVLKNINTELIEKNHADLKIQISDLERMSRLKIVLPKDLQSS